MIYHSLQPFVLQLSYSIASTYFKPHKPLLLFWTVLIYIYMHLSLLLFMFFCSAVLLCGVIFFQHELPLLCFSDGLVSMNFLRLSLSLPSLLKEMLTRCINRTLRQRSLFSFFQYLRSSFYWLLASAVSGDIPTILMVVLLKAMTSFP